LKEEFLLAEGEGCILPDDLYYWIEKHTWAKPQDGLVLVGLTDVAQSMAGKIIVVNLRASGKTLARGKSGGTLESGSGGITIASAGAAALSATGSGRVQSTGSVELGTGNGAAGLLSLAGGATMQVSGAMLDAAATNSSGVISLDGAGTALSVGGALAIGAVGSGTLSLTNGAMLTVAALLEIGTPGGSASGGFGTLSIASTLVAQSDFAIDNARAFFDAGASVSVADTLSVGQGVGGFGTLDVQQGAAVTAQGGVLVGGMGNGILNLAAGATLTTAGTLAIGTGASGQGTLTSGGVLDAAAIDVGGTGTGTLAMDSGSLAVSGALAIGATANGAGFVALNGGSIGGNVIVGGSGAGNLTIGGAASIAGATVSVGVDAGGLGNLTIGGSGLDFTGTLSIGAGGIGDVTVQYGTVTGITDITLAERAGSSGKLSIDSGGTLESVNLTLGDLGQGVLVVDGQLITTGNATIADQAGGAVQTVAIGDGHWTIDGNWTVGDSGSATITVNPGNSQIAALGGGIIGAKSGASGSIIFTPSSAPASIPEFVFAGTMVVGDSGNGTLALQSGSQMVMAPGQSGTVEIGAQSGGSGTISLGGETSPLQGFFSDGASLGATALDVGGTGSLAGGNGVLTLGTASSVAVTAMTVWNTGSVSVANSTLDARTLNLTGGVVNLAGSTLSGVGITLSAGSRLGLAGGSTLSGVGITLSSGSRLGLAGDSTATANTIADTGSISLTGGTITAASVVLDGGTIAGAGAITGVIQNNGSIVAAGGTLTRSIATGSDPVGALSGNGSLIVGAGADLVLDNTPAAGESVAFASNAGTLTLADPSALGATITRLASGDVIDLTQLSYNAADRVALLGGDILEVTGPGGTLASQTLAPGLGFSAADFSLAAAGSGTAITVVPCFVRSTHIRTARGEIAVEALAVGDRVITLDGPRPVVWLGRRRIDLARHPQPEQVRPVRILRDAFGAGLPCRDLVLSPGHTLFIDGALIPAEALVNGASVRRERLARVEYFHVELDRHAVLFSENLPSESYLDIGNRAAFENGPVALLHPDFSAPREPATLRCAPLVLAGAPVQAARAALLARLPALGFARVPGGGVEIHAAEATHRGRAGETLSLRLPAGLRALSLRSPCFVPAGLGPEHEDCRSLGARIDALALDGAPLALDDAALCQGFHPIERQGAHGWRWTDGAAVLRLPDRGAPMTLRLTLGEAPAIWAAAGLPAQARGS
jgi:T5SS/PEP-CTERM-associated repeat protein